MLNWIRFYLGTFFSNKQAKEAANRSFWNVILSLFLFIIILTSFYTITYQMSYPTHYKNANEFKEFAHEVFKNDNHAINIKTAENDTIKAYINGVELDKAINTFTNDNDKTNYSKNNYDLIIDTRDTENIYTNFEIKITKGDEEIDYDKYSALTTKEKKNYTLKINQNKDEVVLDDTFLLEAKTYLEANYNDDYAALDKTKATYNSEVYSLYLTKRYSSAFSTTNLPTVKNYYSSTFLSTDSNGNLIYDKVLLVTNSFTFVSFRSDKNLNVYYVGYYTELGDNFELINDRISTNNTAIYDNVDALFNSLFTSASGLFAVQRFLTIATSMPSMLIMLLIASLLMFLICKFSKQYYCQTYISAFKIIFSFIFWATLIVSLTSIITSFFMDTATVMYFGYAFFLFIIVVRTLVLMIMEFIKYKKNPIYAEADNKEEIVDPESYKGNLDLSNVETGTKVIKNKNVKEDDEEHMEFM